MTTEPVISDERLGELIADIQFDIDTDCVTREGADTIVILRAEQSRRAAEVGMVLVPREPTQAMLEVLLKYGIDFRNERSTIKGETAYAELLSARPK